jgi:hypothetical protein
MKGGKKKICIETYTNRIPHAYNSFPLAGVRVPAERAATIHGKKDAGGGRGGGGGGGGDILARP